VAAASNAAKFWSEKGGSKTRVISTLKSGQVHFLWSGPKDQLWEQKGKLLSLILLQLRN